MSGQRTITTPRDVTRRQVVVRRRWLGLFAVGIAACAVTVPDYTLTGTGAGTTSTASTTGGIGAASSSAASSSSSTGGPACAHDKCIPGIALDPACDPCVAAVCQKVPSLACCTAEWNTTCIGAMNAACGYQCGLQGNCSHSICEVGGPLPGGPTDACNLCVAQVCANNFMPSCCTTAWDATCVGAVGQTSCGAECPMTLASGLNTVNGMAFDDGGIYLAWTSVDGTVNRIMRNGQGSAMVLASGQNNPFGVAGDTVNVYWANNGDGTIMMVPIDGGTPTMLASGQTGAQGVAVDQNVPATFLY